MKGLRRLGLFSTVLLAVAACDTAPVAGPETARSGTSMLTSPQGPADIVDTAIAAGFSRLVEAVQLAGLEDVLRGDGPFTVFAPTNDAFEALADGLSPEAIKALAEDPAALGGILTYHVVPGRVLASDLADGLEVTTVQGETVRFTLNGGARVNDANIVLTDVEASNGVIHVIDAVLLPPQAPEEPGEPTEPEEPVGPADIVDTAIAAGFSRLVEAVQLAGLVDVLRGDGPFTVFAPTNDAFEALAAGLSPEAIEALANDPAALGAILTYHVVPGRVFASDLADGLEVTTVQGETVRFTLNGGARVNESNIILTDVEASNGVIHVIDAVLLPPQAPEEPTEPTEPEEPVGPADIVDTAIAAGFSRLVEAVQLAGLVDVLRGDGPFTVFAPTNDAFEALAAGLTPEEITALANDPAALGGILTYHVVPGRVFASDLADGLEVTTVQGETVRFTLNGGARVNDANIVLTDVEASNGVIHVIDAVLLPTQAPAEPADIVDTAIAAGFSRLVEAVQLAGLVDVLRGDGPFTVFAPTNDAFEALAAGLSPEAIEALANDPAALGGILTYHVVPGRVFASDLADGLEVTTVQGETVRFTLNGGARVNDANIVLTDVEASNGVIHVIDAVLLPPQE